MDVAVKVDVVIVGARCAGAATALLLARAGARVLLIDRGAYGADALSTHALMRGAVLALHRWGVLPAIVSAGTPPVQATTFSYSQHDLTVPIEARFGVSALYAPRRALLDRILVDAATDAGAEVSYDVRLDDLIVDDRGRVRGIIAAWGGARRHIGLLAPKAATATAVAATTTSTASSATVSVGAVGAVGAATVRARCTGRRCRRCRRSTGCCRPGKPRRRSG